MIAALFVSATLTVATPGTGAPAPTMREKVYDKLSKASALASEGKIEDALKGLRGVEKMKNLSGYEKAQLHTAYGFIHFSQDNFVEAIKSYEIVLLQEGLPEALATSTTFTLAQLLFQVEDYSKSIEFLTNWIEGTASPGPEAYVLLGQAHYQLEQYAEAILPVETAIAIAQQRGSSVPENWYLLLRVFHYELSDYQKVLEILEILVREYPDKDYWVHLAMMHGELDNEEQRLAAYRVAYQQGFLEQGAEIVLLSQLLLQGEVPYRAGLVLEKGIQDGVVEGTVANYRLLSQAWTLAQESGRAIDALELAADLSEDGEIDSRLADAYANIGNWESASKAARDALDKGVDDAPRTQIVLGMALFELLRYEEAKSAFRAAQDSPQDKQMASQWVRYIESEETRRRELESWR